MPRDALLPTHTRHTPPLQGDVLCAEILWSSMRSPSGAPSRLLACLMHKVVPLAATYSMLRRWVKGVCGRVFVREKEEGGCVVLGYWWLACLLCSRGG